MFGLSADDLPCIDTIQGPPELLGRVKRGKKNVTVKRVTITAKVKNQSVKEKKG